MPVPTRGAARRWSGRPPPPRRRKTSTRRRSSRARRTSITRKRSPNVSAELPATSPVGAGVTPDYGTDDGHAHAGHNPLVAHQFDDLAQQKEAGILGMWAFL